MTKRRIGKIVRLCLAALFLFSCFTVKAFAKEDLSLTISSGEDAVLSDEEFRIYQVAKRSEATDWKLTGDFADYPVSLNGLNSSGWRALSQTLDAYTARDGLKPVETKVTDETGNVVFDQLTEGLYLVTAEEKEKDGILYEPESFLIILPDETMAVCKYEKKDLASVQTVSRKVLKIWKGEGTHPDQIRAQLLKDGTVYDTVILSDANQWRWEWTDLNGSAKWQIVEADTPDGYTVSTSREGTTFVMTNTRETETSKRADFFDGKLPQTGLLWWPVPVLGFLGILLFWIGWEKWNGKK